MGRRVVQTYHAQIAVEPDFQWIVEQRVTQPHNDKQQLVPTVEAIREQASQRPQEVLTDSGYCFGGECVVPGEEKDRRIHRD